MKLIIDSPGNIEKHLLLQLYDLVESGDQVARHHVQRGLDTAELIAMFVEDDLVVSTATLKNPLKSYREKVFQQSGNSSITSLYLQELGYIVTHPKHEGKRHCQTLLTEFFKTIGDKKMYSTTRKPSMVHILGKFNFEKPGRTYSTDLELLVYNGTTAVR